MIQDTPACTVHMIQDTPASTIWWCSQPLSANIPGNHKLINIVQCSLWTKFTSSPAPTPWRRPGRQDSVFYSGGNFCNLMGPWGVSAVENVKLKCRAAEYPSTGSLYLMEQRSVIRSFYHNILPQLIFPLEHQVCASTWLVWWRVRTTPMFWKEESVQRKILLVLQPHRRCWRARWKFVLEFFHEWN